MLNSIKVGFIVLLTLFTSLNVQAAGGIALGATRVIYPSAAKQTSLAISNSDTQERYLVNSWIENSAGQKEKTFIVTPPLFVSEPKSENTLRIIYAGQPLPGDRESLFWMNVKAIPSVDKSHIEGKNVLQLAILSRIKLFVRPANLPQTPEDAPTLLKFSRVGNHLKITNPSAY
ncbi:type 1 fimbria chaperone FimC, partial [Salmonella enterica subsp. enterica serovar Eko]|nr:type 1 fimbria chaperone FimC [Salmonella enterica subsp. enterica serovar Eko]